MLDEEDIRRAADQLRALIVGVEAGELDAPATTVDQLRGSLLALEALLGDRDIEG